MENSLQLITLALKKLISQLSPKTTPLSFLLVIGKSSQGKTELLKQSGLSAVPGLDEEQVALFYNHKGIILELSESWLNRSKNLLTFSLKQINRVHATVKISGLIFCIDTSEPLLIEPVNLVAWCKTQSHLYENFMKALGYSVPVALVFTKLDTLAGFCEFFQTEHVQDLKSPLGFSLDQAFSQSKIMEHYQLQFHKMIEMLGQKIIAKLHPARSNIKRSLIREFPLQLASLRIPIQTLIKQLSASSYPIHKIYFTSARQGGQSIDKLNQKIKTGIELAGPDTFSQSNNFHPYFLDGAIQDFQEETRRYKKRFSSYEKTSATLLALACILGSGLIIYMHIQTSSLLDGASKELLAYESNKNKTSALYHLSQAETQLGLISSSLVPHPKLSQLKQQMHLITKDKLHDNFVPDLLNILESILTSSSTSYMAKYDALKIYIMLNEPKHYSEKEISNWFNAYWKSNQSITFTDQQKFLLLKTLKQPLQNQTINPQVITDTRNYLNALPAAYFYYSLAKNQFQTALQPVKIEGMQLAVQDMPFYFTKEGFKATLPGLPAIAEKLKSENWVLMRVDIDNLAEILKEAYCSDYANWWKNFMQHSSPNHYHTLTEARKVTEEISKNQSIIHLVKLIQKNTAPEVSSDSTLFNQKIANHFSAINLTTDTAIHETNEAINELEKVLTTLSLIDDKGKAIFELTSNRFTGASSSDPVSLLYTKSRQLPEPLGAWSKQIADESWYLLISQSRLYLNNLWEQQVFKTFEQSIAKRYPFDAEQTEEVTLENFNVFFAPQGKLMQFVTNYLKPFLDMQNAQWKPKELNGYALPISNDLMNELIRANVISNMFFPNNSASSSIDFSLQKINLDPVVSSFKLTIGNQSILDNQTSENNQDFSWPSENASLKLNSIEGNHFSLNETGLWAFFKILQKVNVLVDDQDSSSLQILFEVNGNSGRYLLKTQNQINPFSPGVLSGFKLMKALA